MSTSNAKPGKSAKKLTQSKLRHLRKLAHSRKPVILLGKAGLSESVLEELENALSHHELIKIKLSESDRDLKQAMIEKIIQQTGAELVQKIGHVLVIYRPSKNQVITFK